MSKEKHIQAKMDKIILSALKDVLKMFWAQWNLSTYDLICDLEEPSWQIHNNLFYVSRKRHYVPNNYRDKQLKLSNYHCSIKNSFITLGKNENTNIIFWISESLVV